VRRMLDRNLEYNYRKVKFYDQHPIHHEYPFERFVMNGGAPVDLYEWTDTPDPAPSAAPSAALQE
jgi:hypothetical protein